MHGISVVLALIVAVSAAPKNVQWFEIEPAKVAEKSKLHSKAATDFSPYESAWKEFKIIHEKIYETVEEEIHRFNIFKETVKRIEEHNKKFHMGKKSYYLGINQFSDLTHDEYLKFNGLKKTGAREGGCSTYLKANNLMAPNNVDWRNKGYVTPVKNQGQCGSCWSFSTTGSLEGQHFRKTGKLVSLSEQQLVDCSGKFGNEGCNGGLMDNAFLYVKKAGGIEGEDDYPYKAEQGRCKVDKSLFKADDIGCVDVTSGDEDALKSSVAEVGPVSVAIDASHSSFQSYAGGIYDEPECSSHRLDHGVLTVGYGTDDEGQDYWLVKNSWGTTWGDEGYIKMSRNKDNQCGIATQASYPKV